MTSAAVGRDDQLLLDAGRAPAVGGRPVGLEREDHALLEDLGVIQRDQPAEDRAFPDAEPDAVAVLQRERRLLVGEAELLAVGQTATMSAVVAPGLTSSIAWSMYSRQILYASRCAGEALPTANVR